ncbi:MFS transporter [Nonomuraea rubra]|uniref:MFS transporter n=1 Tax=Nonomuraea rubra TaxID=46180 RepID=UPI00360C6EA9
MDRLHRLAPGKHGLHGDRTLLALTLTGSPVFAGWVAAAGTLPRILLHLPAGVLADYSNRRRVMVGSMVIRAALAVLMVGCLIAGGAGTVYLLPLVSIAQGVCVVLYSAAETAAMPRLVRPGRLARALTDHVQAGAGQRGQHGAAAGDQGEQCGFTDQRLLL